jgi:hypothetical protein
LHRTKSELAGNKGRFRQVGGLYVCGKRYVGKNGLHAWCGRGYASEAEASTHWESVHKSPETPEVGGLPKCCWLACQYVAKPSSEGVSTEKDLDDHLQEHLKAQDDDVWSTPLPCCWVDATGIRCTETSTRKEVKKFNHHVKSHMQRASTQADAEKKAAGSITAVCGWDGCSHPLVGVWKTDTKHAVDAHGYTVGTKERPCLWQGCGNIASKLERAQGHIWEHSGWVRYTCNKFGTCTKKFTTPQAMKLHQRSCGIPAGQQVPREKRYVCPEVGCSYKSAQPGHLNRHKLIHSKEKPFGCPREGCTYRTSQPGHVTRHMLTHGER